ncbi:MAG: hypothetical protein ACKVU1_16865 [bacterium]
MLRGAVTAALVAAFASTFHAAVAHAAYQWEYTPRGGEVRLNQSIFKASHNSQDRNESFAAQIDDFNCWGIEFDMCWSGGQIHVDHCDAAAGDGCDANRETILEELQDLNGARTDEFKITFIMFEVKCEGDFPAGFDIAQAVWNAFVLVFPESWVYTPTEFLSTPGDSARWPSWAELDRRGKHYILFLQGPGAPGHPKFFATRSSRPLAPPQTPSNVVLWNDRYAQGEALSSAERGDFWLSRSWPPYFCSNDSENQNYWNDAVGKGFNLVATNCISNTYTMTDWRVHPPQPIWVDRTSGDDNREWGTLGYQFYSVGNGDGEGLIGSLRRATNQVFVSVEAGDYGVEAAPYTISGSMRIGARGGAVIIR